ncbi:MAG TPA: heparan N-sulfatase, partial [Opitutae bacterium]|nr:heparan N-sulfatase [Opitutae bacterium]
PKALLNRPRFEFYDLESDPYETVNLSDDLKYRKTRDQLMVRLREFQEETRDPWAVKWERE